MRETPPELVDRRLPPPSDLGPPASDGFTATNDPGPREVAARSTRHDGCPVGLGELRYLTVSFRGFDDRAHTGELIVHQRVPDDVVDVIIGACARS